MQEKLAVTFLVTMLALFGLVVVLYQMIEENNYNSQVLDFTRSTYNKFPTRELATFAGVYPPDTFS